MSAIGLPHMDEETPRSHRCNNRCDIGRLIHWVEPVETGYEGYSVSINHHIYAHPTTKPTIKEEV